MLNNEDFAEEYEAEIITLEDDLGNEQDFEYLDTVEYDGEEYIILLPVEAEDEEQNEVMILRVDSLDDENEEYVGIDDEAALQAVFDIFKDRYKDDFDFDELGKLAIDYSDGIIHADEAVNKDLLDYTTEKEIPILKYKNESFADDIEDFYNQIAPDDTSDEEED